MFHETEEIPAGAPIYPPSSSPVDFGLRMGLLLLAGGREGGEGERTDAALIKSKSQGNMISWMWEKEIFV